MESLLDDVGTCGNFQILYVMIGQLPRSIFAFSVVFMAFGMYNPGWSCLDNATNNDPFLNKSSALTLNSTLLEYDGKSCELYESCHSVQFDPAASTVVTEWGLICDRSWIASLIGSAQMLGMLVGSYCIGYIGDAIGRKYTILCALFVIGACNVIIIFSVSWPMFAVLRFLIGMMCGAFRFLPLVLCSEFVSSKWRAPIVNFPTFSISGIICGVCIMVTKDWRQIHAVTAIWSGVIFICMLWLPRSIRWLAVHGKDREAFKVAEMIARLNRKPLPSQESVETLIAHLKNEGSGNKRYSFLHLFKKGTRVYTVIFAVVYVALGLTTYVISWGVKALPGDIYTNVIILYSASNLSNLFSAVAGNVIGRRKAYATSFVLTTSALFAVVGISFLPSTTTTDTGILVLAFMGKVLCSASWYTAATIMIEIYPTVTRGTASGWGSFNAQVGATIAPFLIPKRPDVLYISYLIMGCLQLVCCFFFFLLPETFGKRLRDTWTTTDRDQEVNNTNNEELLGNEKDVNV